VNVLLALVLAPAALLAEGDAQYARRAEGSTGARAQVLPIERALAAYRSALQAEPSSLPARWRLMRALFFRAGFCGATRDQERALREEARRAAEQGVQALERALGSPEGAARIAALRGQPDAVNLYFWSAVSWGEWALARGRLSAARSGAASRVRDLGQTVVELDPLFEQGGGYRILGRLHDQSPRIPFLTGWVSRDKALDLLQRALAAGPQNTVNQLFLAEALLEHAPHRRAEARALLASCARAVPRPEFMVEDAHFAGLAADRLRRLDAGR
jgi:hypothetical protein